MENLLVAVAGAVGAAIVQEAVSRGVSLVLGKRKEKASQGQYLERLRKAVKEVEFVFERTAKMPITEVSLLRDRFELKREFIEAAALLDRRRMHQAPQDQQEILQAVVTGSSSSQPSVTRPAMFFVSSLIGMLAKDDELCLSIDDVDRFEHFADSSWNILRRVESGCSLRRYMFFHCPLVRRLFHERQTLIYRTVQADQVRLLAVWPALLEEERGLEVVVKYAYIDRRRPDKSFGLMLMLRLLESTDIVGIAIKCMQSFACQLMKLAADTAMGELTLLGSCNLQYVSCAHAAPWVGVQEWYSKFTQFCRPDPLCCKSEGHGPTSELSHVFPDEVIYFRFMCYISAPEYSLRSSSARGEGTRSVMRNRRPPLQLIASLATHSVHDEELQSTYAAEIIGDNDEEQRIDITIQQSGETVTSRATNYFLRQPKMSQYKAVWATRHGVAFFSVENPRARVLLYQWHVQVLNKV